MATWREDIARTIRYTEPYCKTTLAIVDLRYVDDFVIDHHEVDGNVPYPVFSTPEERLVMRAKGVDLAEATKIVNARRET